MPAQKSPPWLTFDKVSLRLRSRLFLDGFSWQAHAGEQWAIVGPNGAGKSVLAQLAGGRLHPSGGTITFTPPLDAARDIAWVSFEEQHAICSADARHDISEFLDSAVDAGTTVALLLATSGAGADAIAATVAELGLDALLDRGLRFLSSGEARRALLARAVLSRPWLLVLDDPCEGIDAASRRIVRALIDRLLATPTHVLLLARDGNDLPPGISHILELDAGRIVRSGPRAQAGLAAAATTTAAAAWRERPLPSGLRDAAATCPPDVPLLDLRGVRAWYGDQVVLAGVDLRLDHGEHLCIAGPNGCGKSTLLSLVCGDNPRAYGQQVRVFGRLRGDGESIWELKRRFGIVSNQLHFGYPRRSSAYDAVASGFFDTLGLYDDCSPQQHAIVQAWLELLGLAAQARSRFDALSFGEQRMMLIARAMVKAPPILILDEPCSGLDPAHRQAVLGLVQRIGTETDTHILYVSHEAGELPACIRRTLEFRRGSDGSFRLVDRQCP